MNSINSKTVFITGASSGIGLACAKKFAENGAKLVLAARRLDRLEKLSAELTEKYSTSIHYGVLDVRDNAAVELFIGQIPEAFKSIDILINNAGLSRGLDPVQTAVLDDWEEMIDTNVKGLLYVTRQVIRGMLERNSGHIINIGSIAGHQVYPGGNVYCATKFAVRAITQGIAMEMVNTPIRVSTIDPGMVETEFSLVRYHGDASRADSTYMGLTPLSGEDVADAALFIATRPAHANVAEMVLMPNDQASVYHVNRRSV